MNPSALLMPNNYGDTPIDCAFYDPLHELAVKLFQWKLSIDDMEDAIVKRNQLLEEQTWMSEEVLIRKKKKKRAILYTSSLGFLLVPPFLLLLDLLLLSQVIVNKEHTISWQQQQQRSLTLLLHPFSKSSFLFVSLHSLRSKSPSPLPFVSLQTQAFEQ